MRTPLRRTVDLPFPKNTKYNLSVPDQPRTFRNPLGEIGRILESERPDGELKFHSLETKPETRLDFRLRVTLGEEHNEQRSEGLVKKLRNVKALYCFDRQTVKKPEAAPVLLVTFSLGNPDGASALRWGSWWACADNTCCGDLWASVPHGTSTTFLVSDGVGRGRSALEASQRAAEILASRGDARPDRLIELMHRKLQSTAGAVVFAGRYRPSQTTLEFCSVGNISGYRISQNTVSGLVSLNGTVGYRLPQLKVFEKELTKQTKLVLHSDGLDLEQVNLDDLRSRSPSMNAARLLELHAGNNDDALAAVANVD